MRLSGYILEKYNHMDGAYTCRRLLDEANALNIDLQIVGVHDCCLLNDHVINTECLLTRRDFVINRYKWGKIKDALNLLVRRSYNELSSYRTYVNKYEQVKRLSSNAFSIPEYVLATSAFPYEMLVSQLSLPFVAKGLENSMGREVFLIQNKEDYISLSQKYSVDKEWLFEEFISQSYGRDLRLFSLRGKAVACMMRKSVGDFRANVALGATVEPVEINETLSRIAEDIYKQTSLDFVGIDLLFGGDSCQGAPSYYLCEINVMPGLEGIEKATGVNVAKQILSMIKSDFEHE